MGWVNKCREYSKLVVFSNMLFSLAFGLAAVILAAGGLPAGAQLFWVLTALLCGRTAANAFNRIADKDIDGKNPRTANRHLPAHTLSVGEVWVLVLVCLGGMCLAAGMLRLLCLELAPLAVAVVVLYSYSKRFTSLCHVILGAASAMAPLGVWIALTGGVDARGWCLAAANLFWVAGFDIIYATQDIEFDRAQGLHSIPARFGVPGALRISAAFHAVMLAALAGLAVQLPSAGIFWAGLGIFTILLGWQHRLAQAAGEAGFASMNLSRWLSLFFLALVIVWQWAQAC